MTDSESIGSKFEQSLGPEVLNSVLKALLFAVAVIGSNLPLLVGVVFVSWCQGGRRRLSLWMWAPFSGPNLYCAAKVLARRRCFGVSVRPKSLFKRILTWVRLFVTSALAVQSYRFEPFPPIRASPVPILCLRVVCSSLTFRLHSVQSDVSAGEFSALWQRAHERSGRTIEMNGITFGWNIGQLQDQKIVASEANEANHAAHYYTRFLSRRGYVAWVSHLSEAGFIC